MRPRRQQTGFTEEWLIGKLCQPGYSLAYGSLPVMTEKEKGAGRYGAIIGYEDGIKFDSDGEKTRYQILKNYATMGEISDLIPKPKFELQPAFVSGGRKKRAITYTADFQYTCGGVVWVEDWKRFDKRTQGPFLTETFRRAYKQLMYTHPDLEGRFLINYEPRFLPQVQ